jgi:subtilisin family serine protease
VSVAVVIDVVKNQTNNIYFIETKELLKNQVDFNTDKFKIIGIYDAKDGKAELKDEQVILQSDKNYQGVMSFRYSFENEYGQSVIEKVPVLLRTPDLPRDEKFIQQLWHLEAINVVPVWQKYTGKGVSIAVYDSAFFPSHADIDNNVIHRNNFTVYNSDNIKLQQHALQVASVIAASANDIFYVGIAYKASVGSYQALGSDHPNHNK